MAEQQTRTWPKGTSFETIRDDIFNQLVQYANGLIDDLEKQLVSIQPATQPSSDVPPPNPTPLNKRQGSLPWFKHGVRGFLRKLWYGDHPTNPDWQQMDSVMPKKLTLQEYIQVETNVGSAIDQLISESNFAHIAKGYFDDFKKRLSDAIRHYMLQFHQAAYQFINQKIRGETVPPEGTPPKPSPPQSRPEAPPEDMPTEKVPGQEETPPPKPTTQPPPEMVEQPPRTKRKRKSSAPKKKSKSSSAPPKEEERELSPEEIQAELERMRREEEQSGYDYKGTEGEPGNYQTGEPEEERFD